MELHECILTRNDCCRRGTPLVPRGVMVHSTGANNPYLRRYVQPDDGELGKNRYDNDWNRPGLPVCVHAFLGKKAGGGIAVYQTLPWEVQAWHCGRSGNRTHLAFEICEDGLDDRAYFTAVYREAVELTAYLCRRFGLDPLADGVVLDHAEGNRRGIASAHGDVAHWFPRFGKTMDDFRRETAALLRRPAEKEAEDLTLQELDARIDARIRTVLEGTGSKASSWAQEELARAMAHGITDGTRPGVLKVKVKVNEVITTIMLNTVAASFCQYLAKGPWKNANKNMVAATEQLNARYWFGGLISGSNLSTAILAAAVLALVIWYVMQKTSRGYEMKLTGQNERFARFIGIRTDRLVLVCMLLSGALCGLVGMFRVYGAEHLFRDSISRDYYFEGLMVAMIARYQPLAVVFLSLFFAALKIGAQGMELAAGVPNQIYLIIQTVVIFLMAAESGLFGALQNRVRKGKEAEKHA